MAHKENRTLLQVRIDAARRQILWNCFSGKVPYYLVTEYPKSGGSWFAQMLAAYLQVPFPRNQNVSLFNKQPCLLHGHHNYSNRFKNAVYVLRDGRDVMVSAYYYYLRPNEISAEWEARQKKALQEELGIENVEDIEKNLPKFIEYKFVKYPRRLFRFSWADFAKSVTENDANVVRYEGLLADAPQAFGKAVRILTGTEPDMKRIGEICERFSFKNQSKRNPGEENASSFLRKGIAGDWKNKFSKEACEVFDKHAGEALIVAAYEENHDWVTKS